MTFLIPEDCKLATLLQIYVSLAELNCENRLYGHNIYFCPGYLTSLLSLVVEFTGGESVFKGAVPCLVLLLLMTNKVFRVGHAITSSYTFWFSFFFMMKTRRDCCP